MQFLTKTVSKKFIKEEISSIGFDESYRAAAFDKHLFFSIKIFDLSPSQALIIKQTALSCGCDCATNKGVIDFSTSISDCLLSGSCAQLKNVALKLALQPFSLKNLAQNILDEIEIQKKLSEKTKIMGILNLTPDSFSDGGEFLEIDKAINHAVDMIEDGAEVIDIGAQSTRPGADLVDCEYEIERTVPIITALKTAYPQIELSCDTMSFDCAKAAIECGCDIINDVSFLSDINFAKLCAQYNKKLVIMHSRGNSKTMDKMCQYENVVDDIYKELKNKTALAIEAGLDNQNIILDMGFGFAKSIEQNFTLLSRIEEFRSLGFKILAGVSRKRFLQDVINTKEPKDADIQTAFATLFLLERGVEYIRVHDTALAAQALKFYERLF